jgi:hypothetical protein
MSMMMWHTISLLRRQPVALGTALLTCILLWKIPLSALADPPQSEPNAEALDASDAPVEAADETPSNRPQVEPAAASETIDGDRVPLAYRDYFDAYEAALEAERDLLLYCFAPENPTEEQVEFETRALTAAGMKEAIDERFLMVKIATDDPVQTRTTVTKSRYVRSGLRRVKKTWNQVVSRDLFDGKTSRPGLLVVDVNDAATASEPTIVAYLPFQTPKLSPHVFATNKEFKPWQREVFCSLISTPVASAQDYLNDFCRRQSIDLSCVQREFSDEIVSLNNIGYDYGHTSDNLAPNRISTKLHVGQNTTLASLGVPVSIRIDVYSLNDSAAPVKYSYAQVVPDDQWQSVTIEGLRPETPYRLNAYFYTPGKSPQLIGEARTPFYAVTSGASKVAQARAAIATKALSEVNDWRRGRYDRRKGYVVGRWCERFYCWNILQHLKTPFRDSYSPSIFSRHGALFSGRTMRNMVQSSNVMGDHVRTSDHGFMVLSYDKHLGQVWTIEGNYNNSVVLTRRYLSDYWSLGTIVESMLLEPAEES